MLLFYHISVQNEKTKPVNSRTLSSVWNEPACKKQARSFFAPLPISAGDEIYADYLLVTPVFRRAAVALCYDVQGEVPHDRRRL